MSEKTLTKTYPAVGKAARRAAGEGDPRYGDELAELAAHCEQWAYVDLTGVRSDVA